MKIIIGLAFLVIIGALASAGWFMLKRPDSSKAKTEDTVAAHKRMARALAVRVGVSVAVFLMLLISYSMGWIQPTGMPLR